jgi:hypothetical protein
LAAKPEGSAVSYNIGFEPLTVPLQILHDLSLVDDNPNTTQTPEYTKDKYNVIGIGQWINNITISK